MATLEEIVERHVKAAYAARDRGRLAEAMHEIVGAVGAAEESEARPLLRQAYEAKGNVMLRVRAYHETKEAFETARGYASVDSFEFWQLEAALCEVDFYLGLHGSSSKRREKVLKQVLALPFADEQKQKVSSMLDWVGANLSLVEGQYSAAKAWFLRLAEGTTGRAKSDRLHAVGLATVLEADAMGTTDWEDRWRAGVDLLVDAATLLPEPGINGPPDENRAEIRLTHVFADLIALRKRGSPDADDLRQVVNKLEQVWPKHPAFPMPPGLLFESAWLQLHLATALHDERMRSAAENRLTVLSGEASYPDWVLTDWVPRFSWDNEVCPVATRNDELHRRAEPKSAHDRARASALLASLLLSVLLFARPSLAGTWTVEGKVFQSNGEPARSARVTIATERLQYSAFTDLNGHYTVALADQQSSVARIFASSGGCHSDVNTQGQGTGLVHVDLYLPCSKP